MRRRSSKKRSAISSPPGLPKLPPIYIDESLSQRFLAAALKAHDLEVIIRSDVFRADVQDTEWLPEAGRRGWIVLMKDKGIRRRPLERLAFMNARVRGFVLTAGEMTGPDQAALFVRILGRIRKYVAETPGPFLVRVEKFGGMELMALPLWRPRG